MGFIWADGLWFALVLPLLIAAYVLLVRRRRAAVRYASVALIRDALGEQSRIRRHLPALLMLGAIAALLVALARPVAVTTFASEQRTVVLAIDVSLSMAATDVAPSRLDAAKAAARAFIRTQPRDVRVGIVAFAGEADMVLRPTTRRSLALAALDTLQLNYNTAVGSGLVGALMTIFPEADIGGDYDIFGMGRSPALPQRVARNQKPPPPLKLAPVAPASFRSAAIILLTDGRETIGLGHARAAELAAQRGIRVYTVGFGAEHAATLEVDGGAFDVALDEDALRKIATITRASYHHASNVEELNEIYRTLHGDVVLERGERELTALVTALAAVLLLAAGGLSLAWGSRLG